MGLVSGGWVLPIKSSEENQVGLRQSYMVVCNRKGHLKKKKQVPGIIRLQLNHFTGKQLEFQSHR